MKKQLFLAHTLFITCSLSAQTAFYVDSSNTAVTKNGLSWATAYTSVAQAVNSSSSGDTIYLAKGTYKEGSVLSIIHSLTLKGGYASGGSSTQSTANPTLIDGNNSHRVITVTASNMNISLDHITIQNGHVSSSGNQFASGLTTSSGTTIKMTSCNVINNNATSVNNTVLGGGAYFGNNNQVTMINCKVSGNTISSNGGVTGAAIYCAGGIFSIINSLITKNSSNGSMSISGTAGIETAGITDTCRIINSLICDNHTNSGGASASAIRFPNGSHNLLLITNAIIAGNSINGNVMMPINASSLPQIRFSYLQGSTATANGNIDATNNYPHFIDPANNDYRLQAYSPLINAGDNSALPPDTLDMDKDANVSELLPVDFYGNNRITFGVVDIGTHEFQTPIISNPTALYVDSGNTNAVQDGLSWVTAFPTITAALNASSANDTIYIAQGIYKEGATLSIDTNLVIKGSYPSGGGAVQDLSHATIIDGDSLYRVMEISTNDTVSISHIYVQNGRLNAAGSGAGIRNNGGVLSISHSKIIQNSINSNSTSFGSGGAGIYSQYNQLTLIDCEISENNISSSAGASAGAIHNRFADALIKNCNIYNNTVTANNNATGGGIRNDGGGTMTIVNSEISNNNTNSISSYSYGAGIFNQTGNITILNSIINGNTINAFTYAMGAGLYNQDGAVFVTNAVIAKNKAIANNANGGGVFDTWGSMHLNNTLVADNVANGANTSIGGGITIEYNTAVMQNSIFAGNIAGGTSQQYTFAYIPTINNSYIQGVNPSGANNIDGTIYYPHFADSANSDYHLLQSSPLLNKGNVALLPLDTLDLDNDVDITEALPVDLDNNARIYDCSVDLGPYETVYSLPAFASINDTAVCGNGTAIRLIGKGISMLKWYSDVALNNLIGTGDTVNTGMTAGGVYVFYVSDSAFGCTPIIIDTVTLTIYQKDTTVITESSCNSYTWASNNETYFTSGTYYDTLTNMNNCDSLLILNLTIHNSDTTYLSATSCNSYTWASNNETYFTSGTYYDTLTNMNNCDSILQLNLVIHEKATITSQPLSSITECEGGNILLSVQADNALGFQWHMNNLPLTDGGTVSGTQTNQLLLSSVSLQDAGSYFVIVQSSNSVCTNDTSITSLVAVNSLNNTLAGNNTSSIILLQDGLSNTFSNASCNPIASITDVINGTGLGNVSVMVNVDASISNINGQPYLQRHYIITAANDDTATIVLYATQAEFDAYNLVAGSYPLLPSGASSTDIANVRITQYKSTPFATPSHLITPSSVVWNSIKSRWEITFGVDGFSSFYIHTGANPLSIDIADITVSNHGDRNRLQWSTSSEKNARDFFVERSRDGIDFSAMGKVEAKGVVSDYSYWDENAFTGINYYRLKIFTKNGQYDYSKTVSATVNKGDKFHITTYPNPFAATELITVELHGGLSGQGNITVTDNIGNVVFRKMNFTDQKVTINLMNIASGIYFIKYTDQQQTATLKINKI